MPEHFRALVVILVLAGIVFAFARRPAADLIPLSDFTRRRNLWFALTLLAFFSHSFWVYAGVTAIILTVTRQRERNPLALFFMLLFLIPPAIGAGPRLRPGQLSFRPEPCTTTGAVHLAPGFSGVAQAAGHTALRAHPAGQTAAGLSAADVCSFPAPDHAHRHLASIALICSSTFFCLTTLPVAP